MAEYRLTPAAEEDLEAIWEYTCQEWSMDQADRYIEQMTTVFAELAQSPKIAQACEHIRAGYRRYGVERHVIYFRIATDGIAIVRILHERMDASRRL